MVSNRVKEAIRSYLYAEDATAHTPFSKVYEHALGYMEDTDSPDEVRNVITIVVDSMSFIYDAESDTISRP